MIGVGFKILARTPVTKLLSLRRPLETHLFAYHLVLKHPHTNMILSSFCIPKVVKSAEIFFENRFINKNLRPKNDLDLVFYMCKGGNPKILNLEF